jgi:hypothetical protein
MGDSPTSYKVRTPKFYKTATDSLPSRQQLFTTKDKKFSIITDSSIPQFIQPEITGDQIFAHGICKFINHEKGFEVYLVDFDTLEPVDDKKTEFTELLEKSKKFNVENIEDNSTKWFRVD